jgi:hypothetical protein
MAATESGLNTTLRSSVASTELGGPGTTLADERLLPVVPALQSLLPGRGLRRGATVTVSRSAALALALVAGASAAGSWIAAVGLPDLGIVAAAETGIALERLALVPTPGARAWPTVVAAFLDAVDVVLVRAPARLPAAQARRLAARARERGAVLVPLGAWPEPADLRLAVTTSAWHGLGQGHGSLHSRQVEVLATGRGAATRERRALLWLPSPNGTITPVAASRAVDGLEPSTPRFATPVAAPGAVAALPGAVAAPGAVDDREPAAHGSATLPLRGTQQPRVGLPHAPVGAPAGTEDLRVGPGGPAGLALAGEGDAPAGEGRPPGGLGSPGSPESLESPGLPGALGQSELPLADAG